MGMGKTVQALATLHGLLQQGELGEGNYRIFFKRYLRSGGCDRGGDRQGGGDRYSSRGNSDRRGGGDRQGGGDRYSSRSNGDLVSPLTKESVSINNGGGGNYDGNIETIEK